MQRLAKMPVEVSATGPCTQQAPDRQRSLGGTSTWLLLTLVDGTWGNYYFDLPAGEVARLAAFINAYLSHLQRRPSGDEIRS